LWWLISFFGDLNPREAKMTDEVRIDLSKLEPEHREHLRRRLEAFSQNLTPELAKKLIELTESAEPM
jgi:hypothetical protein